MTWSHNGKEHPQRAPTALADIELVRAHQSGLRVMQEIRKLKQLLRLYTNKIQRKYRECDFLQGESGLCLPFHYDLAVTPNQVPAKPPAPPNPTTHPHAQTFLTINPLSLNCLQTLPAGHLPRPPNHLRPFPLRHSLLPLPVQASHKRNELCLQPPWRVCPCGGQTSL